MASCSGAAAERPRPAWSERRRRGRLASVPPEFNLKCLYVALAVPLPRPGPAVVLVTAVPNSGVAPLIVRWQVTNQTGQNLVQFELDPTGSGTFGSPTPTLDEVSTTYPTPGLVTATLRATSDQGTVYTATTTVELLDPAGLDTVLQARWTRFKDALRRGDIPAALGEVYSRSRARYGAILQAARPDLPNVDTILTDLQLVEIRGNEAIYEMRRTDGGVTKSFEVRFRKDEDGIWRLWMF